MVRKEIGRNLLKKDGGHKIRVSLFPVPPDRKESPESDVFDKRQLDENTRPIFYCDALGGLVMEE